MDIKTLITWAAQNKNAENVLIIRDPSLAKRYMDNWQRRQAVSEVLNTHVGSEKHTFDISLR